MSTEWVHARFKTYQQNQAKKKLREQMQGNALSAAPAMLARLRQEVIDCLQVYNGLMSQYAGDQPCRAGFEDLAGGGFRVSVGESYVRVSRQQDTSIICFEFSGPAADKRAHDCVQAYPNDEGKIGYWYGDESFITEEEVSKLILGPILCG